MQQAHYIAIEKGERQASADEITKIAKFLGRKVHELVRSGEPVTELQPHLRAVAGKMKEKDEQLLLSGIDELQRLAEDYRELEQLMNAPLQFNYLQRLTSTVESIHLNWPRLRRYKNDKDLAW